MHNYPAIVVSTLVALTGCQATTPAPAATTPSAPAATTPSAPAGPSEAPPFVSRVAPRPSHPLEVRFGTSIRLLGYDLEAPDPLRPGDRMRVTWHWACVTPVDVGWRILTHIEADDRPVFSADNLGEVRARWHPARWRAGDFIRDEQTIEVPSEWTGELLRVYVGFSRGGERMAVAPGPTAVVTERARAIELPVRPR